METSETFWNDRLMTEREEAKMEGGPRRFSVGMTARLDAEAPGSQHFSSAYGQHTHTQVHGSK
jgi:hypothetical protein